MKSIWKYPLSVEDKQTIEMPSGARILCVQMQHHIPCLWVVVDTEAKTEKRCFVIIGTGYERNKIPLDYIGTVQDLGGFLVLHVFEDIYGAHERSAEGNKDGVPPERK